MSYPARRPVYKKGTVTVPHGSNSMYLYHGCRCEPCCKAAQEYNRATYRRRKQRLRLQRIGS